MIYTGIYERLSIYYTYLERCIDRGNGEEFLASRVSLVKFLDSQLFDGWKKVPKDLHQINGDFVVIYYGRK